MRVQVLGALVAWLTSVACGSGSSEPQPQTESVARALTSGSLGGQCLHVARYVYGPSFATGTNTGDFIVKAREPATGSADPQTWCFEAISGQANTYRIVNAERGRYLDAYESGRADYRVVLRAYQNDDSQHWLATGFSSGWFRFQQVSTGRYLDSYFESHDEQFVTRAFQSDSTQNFYLFDPTVPAPQVGSCMPQYSFGSSSECALQVGCLAPTGMFYVTCEGAGGGATTCDCYDYQTDELTSITTSAAPSVACEEVLATCIAP
jgi:hypothetical protein